MIKATKYGGKFIASFSPPQHPDEIINLHFKYIHLAFRDTDDLQDFLDSLAKSYIEIYIEHNRFDILRLDLLNKLLPFEVNQSCVIKLPFRTLPSTYFGKISIHLLAYAPCEMYISLTTTLASGRQQIPYDSIVSKYLKLTTASQSVSMELLFDGYAKGLLIDAEVDQISSISMNIDNYVINYDLSLFHRLHNNLLYISGPTMICGQVSHNGQNLGFLFRPEGVEFSSIKSVCESPLIRNNLWDAPAIELGYLQRHYFQYSQYGSNYSLNIVFKTPQKFIGVHSLNANCIETSDGISCGRYAYCSDSV